MPDKTRRRLFNLLLNFFDKKIKEDFFQDTPYRKFYRKIYFETFRHFGFIQITLTNYLQKDTPKEAIAALTLGIAQILFLNDIPDYAAVNESVALVKNKYKSLVNAILRKVVKEKEDILKKYSITMDFPYYFLDRWQKRFESYDEFNTFLEALHQIPKYFLFSLESQEIVPFFQNFNPKKYYPMDINSFLIPNLKNLPDEISILDACAAPGGKTIVLSKRFPKSKITAIENNKNRFEKLRENIINYNCKNVSAVLTDFLSYSPQEKFDLILLDAPCSSLGTIRKHPEVIWLKDDKDIRKMSNTQKKFLAHASNLLKDKGVLIYSVCSLEPEEGEENIDWILKQNKNLKLIKPDINKHIEKNYYFYTLPHKSEGDGFFGAILQRT